MVHKRYLRWFLAANLLIAVAFAQPAAEDKTRVQAMELFKQQRILEALPLFERWIALHPDDFDAKGWLAYALLVHAQTLPDEARIATRIRARKLALEAQEHGVINDLFDIVAAIPEDGHEDAFSDKAEAQAAMRAGETAFAKRDFDAAISAYTRALLLDPKAYYAALFLGDVYFAKRELGSAGQWFERAIEIDPNLETAYRYWGDALSGMAKHEEARAKYIEAIIAEPYNRNAWRGVLQWAQVNKLTVSHPRLDIPVASETKPDGKVDVTMDAKAAAAEDGSAIWIVYEFSRVLWKKEKFSKEFPAEKTYRHSLREEIDSLGVVAQTVRQQLKAGDLKKPNQQLLTLVELSDGELLEPFVLLARPDEGIAQDYGAYRSQHRDKLREYLDRYVVPKKTSSRAN